MLAVFERGEGPPEFGEWISLKEFAKVVNSKYNALDQSVQSGVEDISTDIFIRKGVKLSENVRKINYQLSTLEEAIPEKDFFIKLSPDVKNILRNPLYTTQTSQNNVIQKLDSHIEIPKRTSQVI